MNSPKLNILVLEKDRSLHKTYKTYFQHFEAFTLIGIASRIKPALRNYKKMVPDIIIMEMELADANGLDAIKLIRRRDWSVKIIMISESNDFEKIKKAFKNGANGYLTKPLNVDKLEHALTSVYKDGATISNDIIQKVVSNFHRKTYAIFSDRENQIVDFLCKGATYKMIAEKLFVSTSAVNFHIQNIYMKLDVNSKSEALSKLEQLA